MEKNEPNLEFPDGSEGGEGWVGGEEGSISWWGYGYLLELHKKKNIGQRITHH